MDTLELERLIEIVQATDISELTLRQGDSRLRIRKAAPEPPVGMALVPYQTEIMDDDLLLEAGEEEIAPPEEDEIETVTSTLVGVYRHLKPVIGLGANVQAGQTIGRIEAMGVVVDVKAPVEGKVVDVMIQDSLPVEYGQGLFAIQPEGEG